MVKVKLRSFSLLFLQIEIRMEAQNAVREREKVLNEEVNRLREELERQKVSQTAVIEQGRGGGRKHVADSMRLLARGWLSEPTFCYHKSRKFRLARRAGQLLGKLYSLLSTNHDNNSLPASRTVHKCGNNTGTLWRHGIESASRRRCLLRRRRWPGRRATAPPVVTGAKLEAGAADASFSKHIHMIIY